MPRNWAEFKRQCYSKLQQLFHNYTYTHIIHIIIEYSSTDSMSNLRILHSTATTTTTETFDHDENLQNKQMRESQTIPTASSFS